LVYPEIFTTPEVLNPTKAGSLKNVGPRAVRIYKVDYPYPARGPTFGKMADGGKKPIPG
jgi:hypothetical protein